MNIKQLACVAFAVMLCVSQVACSASNIVEDLDGLAVVLGTAANVPGLPTDITSQLADATEAADCIAAAIQNGGSNAQVAVASAQCGLKAFQPDFPAGTPQTVVSLFQALGDAINKVLADQAQISVALAQPVNPPGTNSGFALSFSGGSNAPRGGKTFNPGRGGKTKVTNVRKALAAARAKLPTKSAPTTGAKPTKQCPPNCN